MKKTGSQGGQFSHSAEGVLLNPGSNVNSPRFQDSAVHCLEEFGKVVSEVLEELWQIQTILEKNPEVALDQAKMDMLDIGEQVLSMESQLIQSLLRADNLTTNDQLSMRARLIFTCERLLSEQLQMPTVAEHPESDYLSKSAILFKNSSNIRDAQAQLPIADIVNGPSDSQIFVGHLNACYIPTRRDLAKVNNNDRKPFEKEVSALVQQILMFDPEYAAMKRHQEATNEHYKLVEAQIKPIRFSVKGQRDSFFISYISDWESMLFKRKMDFRMPQGFRFKTIPAYTAWALEGTLILTLVNLEQECIRILVGLQAIIGHIIQNYITVLMSTYRDAKIDCIAIGALLSKQTSHWNNSHYTEMRKMLIDNIFPDPASAASVIEDGLIPEKLWVWMTEKLGKQLPLAITGVASVLAAYPENCPSSQITACSINFLSICYRLKPHVDALTALLNPEQSNSQSGFLFACAEIIKIGKKLMTRGLSQSRDELSANVADIASETVVTPLSPRINQDSMALSVSAAPNFAQIKSAGSSQNSSPRDSPPPGGAQPQPAFAVLSVDKPALQPQKRAQRKEPTDVTLRKSLQKQYVNRGANPSPPLHAESGDEFKRAPRRKSFNGFFAQGEADAGSQPGFLSATQSIDPDMLRKALFDVGKQDKQEKKL